MKRLVLCADDFALNGAVSQGIAGLAAQGRLSATSVMVLSPRWPQDVALLQPLRGQIDVGLHLDWTSDFALEAGHGRPLGALMARAALGRLAPAAVRVQIERQLDAFEAQWKAPPDHIDGHQHVQQFRGLREALVAAVQRRYPQQTPWLRVSCAPPGQRDLKARTIAAWGAAALVRLADRAGIPHAAWLSGIYDFAGGGAAYARHMARWLAEVPEGTVLMCHPAAGDGGGDAIGPARAWEGAYLGSAAFGALLAAQAVQPVRGQALFAPISV
ncbi:MAG: ChbG/HpnK family deacetylase [Burkholderiaceae bacterium]|nr:ChbG/HpnK family deacetylase [Burkholderiaceae bacterium]